MIVTQAKMSADGFFWGDVWVDNADIHLTTFIALLEASRLCLRLRFMLITGSKVNIC